MMDSSFSRKRRNLSPLRDELPEEIPSSKYKLEHEEATENESTDVKLATLASLYPAVTQEALLDSLINADGSVIAVCEAFDASSYELLAKKSSKKGVGHQTSLAAFRRSDDIQLGTASKKLKTLTRKGQTLHLYTPEDIAAHTPCSIIHDFLPAGEATLLLEELLEAAPTFEKQIFKLFDNVVQSPHSACFYVDSLEEQTRQKTEYLYNGSFLTVGHCAMQSLTSFLANGYLQCYRMFGRSRRIWERCR